MKSHLRSKLIQVTEVIDSETGELLDTTTKHHSYLANSKEEFMLLYVNMLPIFIGLSGPAKSVYAYLLMRYSSGFEFEIGGGSRTLIAKETSLNPSTVANTLTELKESNLLYSQTKGIYRINPRYAFKGSSIDRNKALKVLIELGCKDC